MSIDASDTWKRLKPDDRERLTTQYQLDQLPAIKVGRRRGGARDTSGDEAAGLEHAPRRHTDAVRAGTGGGGEGAGAQSPARLAPRWYDQRRRRSEILAEMAEDQIRAKLKDGPVIV